MPPSAPPPAHLWLLAPALVLALCWGAAASTDTAAAPPASAGPHIGRDAEGNLIINATDRRVIVNGVDVAQLQASVQALQEQMLQATLVQAANTVRIAGGWDGTNELRTVLSFNGRTWTPLPGISQRRGYTGSVTFRGYMYTLGGWDETTLSSIERFDGTKWEAGPPMLTPRAGASFTATTDFIYAVGGGDGVGWLNTVERFNGSVWEVAPSLAEVRAGAGIVTVSGTVVVIGGYAGFVRGVFHDTVECFQDDVGTWFMCPTLNIKRGYLSAATVSGAVYAIGGYGGADVFDSVEFIFDIHADTWKLIAPMTTRRVHGTAIFFNGFVYVIGGYDGKNWVTTAEKWNYKRWEPAPPMPWKQGAATAVIF